VSEAPLPDDKMVGVESDGIPSFPETCLKRKKTLKKKALKAKAFSSHNSIIPAKPILTEKNEGRSNVKYHIVVNWFSNNRVWLQSCQDSLSYIRLYS
jgi:hypothetical protein